MSALRPAVVVGVLAACVTSSGQPPADKKDPQAKVEPKSAPGAGQKFLETFVGDWDVAKKFFPRGGGEPSVARGTCRQEMTHAGRFLKSEFVFDGANGKSTGTGNIGFEPDSGTFTSTWIDSRQTRMSFRQSADGFDGKTIKLEAAGVNGPPGRKSRTETTLEEGGAKIVHRQYNPAADGTESLLMELVLTRKPAAGR